MLPQPHHHAKALLRISKFTAHDLGVTLLLTSPWEEPPEWLQPRKGGMGADTGYPDTPVTPQHLCSQLLPLSDAH